MRILLTALAATLLITACSGDSEKALDASGFMTANPEIVPEDAIYREGETIPRDENERPYAYDLLGATIPDFTLETASGETVTRQDLLGKWTIIEFWGLWCPDCMADAPYVKTLADEVAKRDDLNFLTIHTPPNAARADEAYGKYGSVKAYFEAVGYEYPTAIDFDASVRDAFLIPWTPSYLVLDPTGRVKGYRTDFSVAGKNPVEAFLRDVDALK